METPTLNQTIVLANEEEAFALEPVAITRRHHQTTSKLFSLNSRMCILQIVSYSSVVSKANINPLKSHTSSMPIVPNIAVQAIVHSRQDKFIYTAPSDRMQLKVL